MGVQSFYVFTRSGKWLYYDEWDPEIPVPPEKRDDDTKLMFGLIYTFKSFAERLSKSK